MAKNRLLYAIGLIAALAMSLFSWTWQSVFLLLLAIALPVLSALLTVRLTKRIDYEVAAPAAIQRGERLAVMVSDKSYYAIPEYIVQIEMTDSAGEKRIYTCRVNIDEDHVIDELLPEHCGVIRCRTVRAYATDYLGLFRFRLKKAYDTVTVIMPVAAQPVPTPVISQISTSYRPKYGGGFAEVHDMREYRAGDSMRDVHWKLSAKTDRIIVREPQEPDRSLVLLTIGLIPPSSALDERLDNLIWVSRWLCENDIAHEVRWLDAKSHETASFAVNEQTTPYELIRAILSEPIIGSQPSIASISFADAGWRYHIGGEEK